jgi:hypothetical protein
MSILNIAGRIIAMVLGIIGAIIALIEVIVSVGSKWFEQATGVGNPTSHGFLGTLAFLLGIIGALLALPFGEAGAVLMAIAGLIMLYVTGWVGIIPFIFLILGAILAYLDRGAKRRAAA